MALLLLPRGKIQFLPKNVTFCKKTDDINKIKGFLALKGRFSKTANVCVLHTKFQVSSMILFSFTQGAILPTPSTAKQTPKKPT